MSTRITLYQGFVEEDSNSAENQPKKVKQFNT